MLPDYGHLMPVSKDICNILTLFPNSFNLSHASSTASYRRRLLAKFEISYFCASTGSGGGRRSVKIGKFAAKAKKVGEISKKVTRNVKL